jgi:glycosyltransferase involved in cell wall biosynthesis
MKIAFVKDAVYPWLPGGAQKRNWEVARRLSDDHDVHMYGMHLWDGPQTIEKEGVTIHGVSEPRDLYIDGRRSIKQALHFTRKLVPPMLKADPDIIDCQKSSLFPFFAAKSNTLVNDSTLVGMWTEVWGDYWYEYLGAKGFFGKQVERAAVKMPDVVIAISDYIKSELHSIGRTNNIEVVHNGVDYEWIQDIRPAGDQCDVAYLGRINHHKNVDMILEAVSVASKQIGRPITCRIIGDGPQRESLERYAEELEVADQVDFMGFIENHKDVMAHLKTASVFVLPSQQEGFSGSILEANACGLPSVITDEENSGNTAIVEDGETGYIVKPNSESLAGKIVDVVENERLRRRLAKNADSFSSNHNWDNIVNTLEGVYLRANSDI